MNQAHPNAIGERPFKCCMVTLIFRCPTTGLNVQAWFADDSSTTEDETYETVKCLACDQTHLINRSTGKTLGDDKE